MVKVLYTPNIGNSTRDQNYGDMLTPFIFQISDIPIELDAQYPAICGIGSILQSIKPDFPGIIWSSGFIYPTHKMTTEKPPLAVRGRLTLKQFPCDDTQTVLGDGALILSRIYPCAPTKTHELGVILHYIDLLTPDDSPFKWPIFEDNRVLFIDSRSPPADVILKICSCKRVISSSLHGIITCDSYGIPHALISCRSSQDAMHVKQRSFKFHDYYSAFDMRFEGVALHMNSDTSFDECVAVCRDVEKPTLGKIQDGLIETLRHLHEKYA
jgi:pyruvyltransferase